MTAGGEPPRTRRDVRVARRLAAALACEAVELARLLQQVVAEAADSGRERDRRGGSS